MGHTLQGQLLENGSVVIDGFGTISTDDYRSTVISAFYYLHEPSKLIVLSLYSVVFLLAAVCNLLVIVVIFRFQHLHSVTNYFLVNLSVADLLVTMICMPMAMSQNITVIWFYGLFMCKFVTYLQGVAASSSMFSILAMSIDRYFAIRHPIVFRQFFNKRVARCVILSIWVVASLVFIPVLVVQHEESITLHGENAELVICKVCKQRWEEDWNKITYSIFLFVATYVLPVLLVITAYIRMGCKLCTPSILMNNHDGGEIILNRDSRLLNCRRRVARTLLIIAIVFAVCWMPYNLTQLFLDTLEKEQLKEMDKTAPHLLMVHSFSLWLGHANSAINPLLYCLLSRNIRQSVANLFRPTGRNLRNSSEPVEMLRRRGPVSKKRPPIVKNGCSNLNRQKPEPPSHQELHQVNENPPGRDLIVMNRLSPLTPPSIKKLMGSHSQSFITIALMPIKIVSFNKILQSHSNKPTAALEAKSVGDNGEMEDLDSTPNNYYSL
ncbi:QRFP-like peptide receptor isoform X1 [Daphnia pulicaria]|uniref:QRFP-like peptide receptor isoform X1 n=1 Tax=Daphnia pulicaria TaxID=35523 RepID=UPI001EEAA75A|nr:QRFP-like peptide receptor isoform X1 [Daphnia pulicaria]